MNNILDSLITVLLILMLVGFSFAFGNAWGRATEKQNLDSDTSEWLDEEQCTEIYRHKEKKKIAILLNEWRKKNGV